MFERVTLRGATYRGASASVVWAYHTAATIARWTVAREARGGTWRLSATVARANPYYLRQRPLLFTAPRRGGFFCWPIQEMTVTATTITATLGPLEY